MAAPTYVSYTETGWGKVSTRTRTTASISVNAGDRLAVFCAAENEVYLGGPFNVNFGVSDSGGNSWTAGPNVGPTDYSESAAFYATAASTGSITVTVAFDPTNTPNNFGYGCGVYVFRDSDGFGATASTNAASGAPSVDITTTQANSAVLVIVTDWNAVDGASRTWRTNAGSLTERVYDRDASTHTYYSGYHADAGAAGTYAVGLSAPSGQKYTIIALEVQGTSSPPPPTTGRGLLLGVG